MYVRFIHIRMKHGLPRQEIAAVSILIGSLTAMRRLRMLPAKSVQLHIYRIVLWTQEASA